MQSFVENIIENGDNAGSIKVSSIENNNNATIEGNAIIAGKNTDNLLVFFQSQAENKVVI